MSDVFNLPISLITDTLAAVSSKRDTFSSGRGRQLQTVMKMALKGFLALAVVFIIISLLPQEGKSEEGPKVTEKV